MRQIESRRRQDGENMPNPALNRTLRDKAALAPCWASGVAGFRCYHDPDARSIFRSNFVESYQRRNTHDNYTT